MIHVRRPKAPPEILTSPAAKKEQEEARRFFGPRKRSEQERFDFKLYRHPDVRKALNDLFHGKCAYCESFYGATQPVGVEHHRPKALALDLDGAVASDHYWWLASEWTNLLAECADCARSKRTRFPVQGRRAETEARGPELRKERALLLDPCADQPDRHLVFTEDGIVVPTSDRGKATILVLALNRAGLVNARRGAFASLAAQLRVAEHLVRLLDAKSGDPGLQAQVHAQIDAIRRLLEPSQPYACLHRQFIHRWLDGLGIDLGALDPSARTMMDEVAKGRLVSKDEEREVAVRFQEQAKRVQEYSVEGEDQEHKEAFYAGKKWIEWIEIENFKAIERIKLTFPTPSEDPNRDREPWLMILGENGTGKSSILQAVALALMGEKHSGELGLDAATFVRRAARRGGGRVRVKLNNVPDPVEVRFRRSSSRFEYRTAPKVFLLGYGATRLLSSSREPNELTPRRISIENLFDPRAPLADVESWLMDRKTVSDAQFDVVGAALKDLLLLDDGDSFARADDGVVALLDGQPPVPLRHLSDGFQSVVALCGDVMKSLLDGFPTMQEAEGIVLLDEIEAHLHPTWKIEIVNRLRKTFPSVAFLVSTHDPLCLKGLEEGEIVVLQRDENRKLVPITNVPPVNDLRADQILTSFLFGLHSTRGDDASAAIARYAELYGTATRTPPEEKELAELGARLDATLTKRESPGQRRIEEAIARTLADEGALTPAPAALTAPSPDELELRRQLDELLGVSPE
jgi:uncharacterized protein (TIGR02646 family)